LLHTESTIHTHFRKVKPVIDDLIDLFKIFSDFGVRNLRLKPKTLAIFSNDILTR
jgi:hypothetical protein